MDCHSEFTCSERTKRRRIRACVANHVKSIAGEAKSKSDEDDFVVEVDCRRSGLLPPHCDLVDVPVATNFPSCSIEEPPATTDDVSYDSNGARAYTCDVLFVLFDDSHVNSDSEDDDEDEELEGSVVFRSFQTYSFG